MNLLLRGAYGEQVYINQDDAYTTKWMQTTYRCPGEDAISLATRVENAYLEWWDSLDEMSLYRLPENSHSHQIRTSDRFALAAEK